MAGSEPGFFPIRNIFDNLGRQILEKGDAFDRATGNFQIYVSNAVIPNTSIETGAGGMEQSRFGGVTIQ